MGGQEYAIGIEENNLSGGLRNRYKRIDCGDIREE
jgi:hypothetical protein